MSQDDDSPPRRFRKWLLWLGLPFLVVFVLPLAIAAAIILWDRHVADRELQVVCAELDEKDPGWRWEEIEASLPAIPDEENGALRVAAVSGKLPYYRSLELEDLEPPEQLSEDQTTELAKAFRDVTPVLEDALAFARIRRGRFVIEWLPKQSFPDDSNTQDVRSVAHLLAHLALWRAQDNDLDGAWVSSQAAYNVGCSLGQPRRIDSLEVRNEIRSVAIRSMQRTLAQGAVSDTALAATQQILEEDAALPLLHQAYRGERALVDRFFVNLETGALPPQAAGGFGVSLPQTKIEELTSQQLYIPRNHAWYLRHMNELVAAADESLRAVENWDTELSNRQDASPLARALLLRQKEPAIRYYPVQAKLYSTIVALAVERYRLKHGHWPSQLGHLIPIFLKELPFDLVSGAPLQYILNADYVTIDWSGSRKTITDTGFRLWNPDRRRQPPKPKAPRNPDDND